MSSKLRSVLALSVVIRSVFGNDTGYKKGPYTRSKLKTGQIFFSAIKFCLFFCLSGKNNRE